MVAPNSNYQLPITNYQLSIDESAPAESQSQTTCALCSFPAPRHITDTIAGQALNFCCYGCRHIYEIVAPELAQGVDLRQAMGRAGLDLNAPCCRGVINGDPAEEAKILLSRLMLNAFLAMMVMALSLALYSDFIFAEWGSAGQNTRSMLQTIAMLFATPAVLLLALPILEDAIFTFQVYRRLTTSALIAVGSLAAYGLSVYATFTGVGHTYFETAVMTLLLVTAGRWLDARTQAEGDKALNKLLARTPVEASLITSDGKETRIPVDKLNVGDLFRVRPGQNFAADGRVVSGEGSVNQASITGEATPAYKGSGHTVYAGTTNLDGSFVVETTHIGDERVMGKLIRLLEEARLKRAPIEKLADQVASYFAPTVMLLAAGTFIYWTWQVSFEWGLLTALAVLLIACPCALGIATPLTIWAALGRAAQKGVLIRDSSTLEKLSHVRQIFFDKTGTLTTGQSTLTRIVPDVYCSPSFAAPSFSEKYNSLCEMATRNENLALTPQPPLPIWERGSRASDGGEGEYRLFLQEKPTEASLLRIAASLEYGSEHPLARSMLAAASAKQLKLLPVEKFKAWPGLGISGVIQGQTIFVGSWRLVEQQNLKLSEALRQMRQQLEQAGLTVVHIGWDGAVQGLFGFADELRSTARPALDQIQQSKLSAWVLTGDSVAVGNALSAKLGIPVQSQLLPQDKVSAIENAASQTLVAMVGDGLNDAPALARAGVGIALGCGADVTREAADISLISNDLTLVSWTIALARRVYRTIGWNLTWAFIYNVIGIGLAMAGLLHPVLAAIAMVASSALVVGNSLRIFRF